MKKWRIGLRAKLLVFSSFLFVVPYLAYQYVWELEKYLRMGQEQTMVGTARAVAMALHERPSLFNAHSSFQSSVRVGTDLYAHQLKNPIQLDGALGDWDQGKPFMLHYAEQNLIEIQQAYRPESLSFVHMIGQYDDYLYAVFKVQDDSVIYRARKSLKIDRNDYLQVSMNDSAGKLERYAIAPMQSGWVNAFLLKRIDNNIEPQRLETRIQGYWQETQTGYSIELRIPVNMISTKIAFAITDVDDSQTRFAKYTVGTANPKKADSLGTILIPSPEIENILRSLQYSNARVWVIDKHRRVLAKSGEIQQRNVDIASSLEAPVDDLNWWEYIESQWLLPIYYKVLTEPPVDFIDDLDTAFALEGKDITDALNGKPSSVWRSSSDDKAVILSASHPIYIEDEVMGAVVVEQTTNNIIAVKNRALENQFHFILIVVLLGTVALFLLASRISLRIRKLRNQTESAIDTAGKIVGSIQASETNDELGDLSRTFTHVLSKLKQYNNYLENMASRLSHELRTPVAIVNSSLDNLAVTEHSEENKAFIQRAKEGAKRLSKILTNMSEATRLEQAMQGSEMEAFMLDELLSGCIEGYRLAYPERYFLYEGELRDLVFKGVPELFAQMLDKVIANAVEFSPSGSSIRISLQGSNKKFRLFISNQGCLLPENMRKELLDSMISIRQDQSSEQAHLGLGLYIAKLIALFHGLDINIENQTDESGVVVILRYEAK